MNRTVAWAVFLLLLLLAGCGSAASSSAPAPAHSVPAPDASSIVLASPPPPATSHPATAHTATSHLAAPQAATRTLRRVHDPGQVTGTLSGPCTYRAGMQLPDPRCTPGSYDPLITAAVLCSGSYSTRGYRPPESQTQAFKYGQAYPAYGVAAGTRTELDHLVSLELGGSNDASNLWPEIPPVPNPKDSVENALHAWVCAAAGSTAQNRLTAAQRAIARNWVTAEKVLGIAAGSSGQPERVSQPAVAVTSHAAPAHAACHPLSDAGNCYERGEFCRKADLGVTGVAGNGARITCTASGSRSRWE